MHAGQFTVLILDVMFSARCLITTSHHLGMCLSIKELLLSRRVCEPFAIQLRRYTHKAREIPGSDGRDCDGPAMSALSPASPEGTTVCPATIS